MTDKPKAGNLDTQVKEKIEHAVNSKRIDHFLSLRLQQIVAGNDASLLERRVSFLAEGNPAETPQGLTKLTGGFYSGYNQTYDALVGYVNLCDADGKPFFSYFEAKKLSQPK